MPRGKGVKRKSRTAPRAAPYTRQRGDSEAEAASTPEPVADPEPEFVQLAGDNAHPPGNVFGALLASNLPCNNFDIPDSISSGIILQGEVGEILSLNCLTSPYFELREKFFTI